MDITIRGGVSLDVAGEYPRCVRIEEDETLRVYSYDGEKFFVRRGGDILMVYSDQTLDPVEVNKFDTVKREVRRRAEEFFEDKALSEYNEQMKQVSKCADLAQLQLYCETELGFVDDKFARLVFDSLK